LKSLVKKTNWMIERWWSKDERVALGVTSEANEITQAELIDKITSISQLINEFIATVEEVNDE
jgi:type I restriction enzyme M protein